MKLISVTTVRKPIVKQVKKNAAIGIQIGVKVENQDQFRNPNNLNIGNVRQYRNIIGVIVRLLR